MAGPSLSKLGEGTRFSNLGRARHGHVVGFMGAGGQGSVYEVEVEGARFALKWYHDSYICVDLGLKTRLARAVERGAPNAAFLWPLDLVEIEGQTSFGYIMPIRRSDYRGMRDLIARPPDRVELTLSQRFILCSRLAEAFLQLHAAGFCYQDINFGNIFFNPQTADVLICDNDNVNVDGADASIYGTRKFMAPEVVRRETLPNTKTDLFSMSVLFFYAVMGWHPLDGKREAGYSILNADAEMSLYGTAPLFLFDPSDDANGPMERLHDPLVTRWTSLPATIQALFMRAFTAGLNDPNSRVLERQWRTAFADAAAATFACEACGYEHVIQAAKSGLSGPSTCARCDADLALPLVLKARRGFMTCVPNQGLPHHVLSGGTPDFTDLVGLVEAHPSKDGLCGLRNLSDDQWTVCLPGRDAGLLPPGKAIGLIDGSDFQFSSAQACVVRPNAAARDNTL